MFVAAAALSVANARESCFLLREAIHEILGPLHNVLFEQHRNSPESDTARKSHLDQHIDFPVYANYYPSAATFKLPPLAVYTAHTCTKFIMNEMKQNP